MRISNQPFSLLPVLLWINTIRAYADGDYGHLKRRAADCFDDNCARAVTGTRHGPDFQSTARADCSNFMHAIQTVPAANITVTTSAAFFPNSSITSIDATGAIPTYASACSESSDYVSACSCWGITRATITSATGTMPTVTSQKVNSTRSSSGTGYQSLLPTSHANCSSAGNSSICP